MQTKLKMAGAALLLAAFSAPALATPADCQPDAVHNEELTASYNTPWIAHGHSAIGWENSVYGNTYVEAYCNDGTLYFRTSWGGYLYGYVNYY